MRSREHFTNSHPLVGFAWGSGSVALLHIIHLFLTDRMPPAMFQGQEFPFSFAALLTMAGGGVGTVASMRLCRTSAPLLLVLASSLLGFLAALQAMPGPRTLRLSVQQEMAFAVALFTTLLFAASTIGWAIFPKRSCIERALLGGMFCVLAIALFESSRQEFILAKFVSNLPIFGCMALCFGIPGSPPLSWTCRGAPGS